MYPTLASMTHQIKHLEAMANQTPNTDIDRHLWIMERLGIAYNTILNAIWEAEDNGAIIPLTVARFEAYRD